MVFIVEHYNLYELRALHGLLVTKVKSNTRLKVFLENLYETASWKINSMRLISVFPSILIFYIKLKE